MQFLYSFYIREIQMKVMLNRFDNYIFPKKLECRTSIVDLNAFRNWNGECGNVGYKTRPPYENC